jgi:hypothetical protein
LKIFSIFLRDGKLLYFNAFSIPKNEQKKFQKNINFYLQVYFNMEILLNSWISLLNSEMNDIAQNIKLFYIFAAHRMCVCVCIV